MGMARAMVSIISLDAWHGGEGTGARSVGIEVAGREALRTKVVGVVCVRVVCVEVDCVWGGGLCGWVEGEGA